MNDSQEYEELLNKFLEIFDLNNVIKIMLEEYSSLLDETMKNKKLLELVESNKIFDVLQSVEGLNSSFFNNSQKILKMISAINPSEELEKEIINKNKTKKNDDADDFIDKVNEDMKNKKENKRPQNKLVNNALEYLEYMIKKNIIDNKGSEKDE